MAFLAVGPGDVEGRFAVMAGSAKFPLLNHLHGDGVLFIVRAFLFMKNLFMAVFALVSGFKVLFVTEQYVFEFFGVLEPDVSTGYFFSGIQGEVEKEGGKQNRKQREYN